VTFPFVGTHTESGWNEWDGRNHAVEEGAVTIATADRLQYVDPTWLVAEPPLPFRVVDLDVEACGDVWLLTAGGDLYRFVPDREDLRRLHCTWDRPPANPRAVAVTGDTVYVATGSAEGSDPEGGRVLGFSKHLLQLRWVADDPHADPVALARHGETVSVLDRGDGEPSLSVLGRGGAPRSMATGFESPVDLAVDSAGDRYVLDRLGDGGYAVERVPADETAGETAVPPGEFVVTGDGAELTPDALAVGVPGDVVVGVADAAPTEPSLFRHDTSRGEFERLTTHTGRVAELLSGHGDGDAGLYVVGTDDEGDGLRFLPATEHNRLNPDTGRYDGQIVRRLDAGERGTQWHRLTASFETPPGTQVRVSYHATDDGDLQFREPGTPPVTPLERVDGVGPVIADRLRAAHVRGLAELVELSPERVAELAGTDGYPVSASRAADWLVEAEEILAGFGGPGDLDWLSVGPPDPEDALLTDAEGRYLWVKVELVGTATAAPRIESLRVYFPRRSYLRYLPAVFRDDPESAAFLARYLSLFESVFTDVEEEIAAATRYLDPDGAPGEALSWLAGWLALSPDETWSTAAKRTLVRRAHELFEARGTRRGVRELLSIYLSGRETRPPTWQWAIDRQREAIDEREATVDEREAAGELDAAAAERARASLERERARLDRTSFVWERSDLACIDEREHPEVSAAYERLLPCPQCFAVLLWPSLSEDSVREVQRLVETTRPAHAVGRAIQLQPRIRLAGHEHDRSHHTFLGVNSALADREFALESSGLGADTRLSEHEASGQYGTKQRLGIDTDLSQ